MNQPDFRQSVGAVRERLHEIIFEADTRAGKTFDVVLIISIVLSVLVVMVESVNGIRLRHGSTLYVIEWFFTILFTVEYVLRLWSVRRPLRYVISPLGLIDLMAIVPTYLSLLIPGAQSLLVIRVLRLLRIFRVFKLAEYLSEAHLLVIALRASRRKISVFLIAVLTLVVIIGTLMHLIEGEQNGFTDIPTSMYWAIVTLTTVGYGDISPNTPLGQALASLVMLLGYGIIAVPTGIVTLELSRASTPSTSTQACPSCSKEGHDDNARYCKFCGAKL